MKRTLLLAVIALIMVSCGKEKIDEHPNFVGNWSGSDDLFRDYEITIEEDGSAYYYRLGIGYVERTGNFKVVSGGDKVKIAGKKMDINQYPTETDESEGLWEMQLDNIYLWTYK